MARSRARGYRAAVTYRLDAVVGDFDHLRNCAEAAPDARVAPLKQRMGLLVPPAALGDDLPRALCTLSRGGPLARLEADFWGGDGSQTAALWRDGALEWGPVHTRDFTGRRDDWPINAALARLGVLPAAHGRPEHWDLFAEVGLARARDEQDWRRAALEAYDAADYAEWYANEQARREREARHAAERDRCTRLPGVPTTLDGKEIMALLGVPPGRTVGRPSATSSNSTSTAAR